MSWAAVIAGGAALIGGAMSANASKKAGDKSAAGSAAGLNEQARQYDTTRADTAPYRAIGTQAINALGGIYGYQPALKPQSMAEWSAANPIPANLIGNDGRLKTSGGTDAKGALIQGTDPLGLYSGGGTSAKRALDPLGLFGGGADKPKGLTQEQAIQAGYQKYLQGFDSNPTSGNALTSSAPKSDPRDGVDPSSGYRIDGAGGVSPGLTTGAGSAAPAGPDYSAFFKSPDYQFRRDQGIQGIERTASARGLTGSGNALAALDEYNSNLAAGEFGNYFNRQAALAGIGQTATNTATTAGMNAANNSAALLQNAADARASGVAGQADAWGNALGTIGGIAYDRWGRPKKTVGG